MTAQRWSVVSVLKRRWEEFMGGSWAAARVTRLPGPGRAVWMWMWMSEARMSRAALTLYHGGECV